MILILIGTPGVGKSYVGRVLQEKLGFYFYDADDDLTPEMLQAIQNEELFTDTMRDTFYHVVSEQISKLRERYSYIVVAQAFAKERNRLQLLQKHPDAQFILVEAKPDLISQRLLSRNNAVTPAFAEKVRLAFEHPLILHECIKNNHGDTEIVSQFKNMLDKLM